MPNLLMHTNYKWKYTMGYLGIRLFPPSLWISNWTQQPLTSITRKPIYTEKYQIRSLVLGKQELCGPRPSVYLVEVITHWLSLYHNPWIPYPPDLSQYLMRLEQVIISLLSPIWCTYQASQLEYTKYWCPPIRWTSYLIRRLLEKLWDIWKHRNHFIQSHGRK